MSMGHKPVDRAQNSHVQYGGLFFLAMLIDVAEHKVFRLYRSRVGTSSVATPVPAHPNHDILFSVRKRRFAFPDKAGHAAFGYCLYKRVFRDVPVFGVSQVLFRVFRIAHRNPCFEIGKSECFIDTMERSRIRSISSQSDCGVQKYGVVLVRERTAGGRLPHLLFRTGTR